MIDIIGNVGNQGYALPMVQAYPVDLDGNYILGWNPTLRALDYVPFVGTALGDIAVTRDLAVARDLAVVRNTTIAGTLAVTGVATFTAKPVFSSGVGPVTSDGAVQGTSFSSVVGANTGLYGPQTISFNGVQVVAARKTGWAAATGTATRSTFVTSTVTLPLLAERVKALLDDLTAHGLIGP